MGVFSFALLLLAAAPLRAQVSINEISICNVNGELDPNYDYSGWIELYNSSDADLNIKNFYFSDEAGNPIKYKLSSDRTLPAKGYAVVWFNDEIRNSTTGYTLDTDANDGGILTVADANGNIYDSMTYTEQFPNVTYGRPSDGDVASAPVYFIESTFCKSNNGSATGIETVKTPKFSLESGFYDGAVTVAITCKTADAKIYYTTDTSEPTVESTLYTGEIQIDKTTVLRAKAFKDGFLTGIIGTATYLINERKPESLPVVFLTTDTANLWNDSIGIYCVGTNGIYLTSDNPVANYNRDWTRWAHVEYTNKEHGVSVNQSVGIGINGNASRGYPQKSFKVKAKTRYGENRFDAPLFPSRDGLRYKSILLRSGGQYYNSIPLLHDACIQSLADVTPLDYQAATPAVVYLNGEYWGIYNLRERKNEDIVYSHYGLDDTAFDIVEFSWRAVASHCTLTAWNEFSNIVQTADFSNDEEYAKVCELMDIDSYLYYMSIEIMLKNSDWPTNNQLFFHPHTGKWKWILQDTDKCIENGNPKNLLKGLMNSTSDLLSNKLIVLLLNNEKFKEEYITVQSLVAGSVYAPDRFATRMNAMKDVIAAEYSYHQARWTEQGKGNLSQRTANTIWCEEMACSQIYDHMKENFSLGDVHALTINSDQTNVPIMFNNRQIPVLPYDGKWFEGKTLQLQAPLYDKEKKFAYWEITGADGSVAKQTETTLNLSVDKDMQVVAVYETTTDARRSGIFINEISANNASFVDNEYKYEDWIEIYNASEEDIDLGGYYVSNKKEDLTLFQIAASDAKTSTIPAMGYGIIWCSKKPERGIMHTRFKLGK
jgi:hypothetical protein